MEDFVKKRVSRTKCEQVSVDNLWKTADFTNKIGSFLFILTQCL